MMDSSLRRQILGKVMETSPALRESAGITEQKQPAQEDKIFEFRNHLKQLKSFESNLKKEAEDFTEEDWKAFESVIKPKDTMGMLESMLNRREIREKQEADKKKELRAKIFEKIDFNKIGKL